MKNQQKSSPVLGLLYEKLPSTLFATRGEFLAAARTQALAQNVFWILLTVLAIMGFSPLFRAPDWPVAMAVLLVIALLVVVNYEGQRAKNKKAEHQQVYTNLVKSPLFVNTVEWRWLAFPNILYAPGWTLVVLARKSGFVDADLIKNGDTSRLSMWLEKHAIRCALPATGLGLPEVFRKPEQYSIDFVTVLSYLKVAIGWPIELVREPDMLRALALEYMGDSERVGAR